MTQIRGEPIQIPMEGDAAGAAPSESGRSADFVTDWEPGVWDDRVPGEPMLVTFDQLAGFEYAMQAGTVDDSGNGADAVEEREQIPASIRMLDGQLVGLRGFMLPTRLEGGLTTEFLLMRDHSMCCFGVIPRINEWVGVTMEGRGVRPLMDQAVTVFGVLHVGESYENGVLVGIYRMDGQDLAGPLDL